ncbi:MAG: TonB-dependent receptor [Alphaproteobacteria bacterium]|nr:TonB-dependent receptor [Alphaproteobacteria bacterium]
MPLAVSVVGGKQLEATGTYNVSRLTQLQPSVQYFASNPRNSNINIRGLGAPFGLTNDGIEQGVGLYIDQVYYSRPAAASFDFIDIDRIEVLRGPQGTLYGKNTTAGALNITTRRPSFQTEGRFELSAGNLDFVQAKGSISGPFSDTLAGRLAVTATTRRGTLYNVHTGRWVNGQRNIGARGSLFFKPSDRFDLLLSADFNRQSPECCAQLFVRVAPTLRNANRQFESLAAASGYAVPSRDPFDRLVDNDSTLKATQNFGGLSLLGELRLGGGTLTSVTAWRFWDWYPSSDRDFIGLPITTVSANPSKQRQLTQEFRYASNGKHRIDYVLGAFAYRQVIDSTGIQEQGSAASLWLLGPASANIPALLNGLRQETRIHFENNSLAAFGQLTWNVTDTLRVQPGLRLNWDSKKADYNAVMSGGLANPTAAQAALMRSILAPQAYNVNFSASNLTGDINVSWKPAKDVLVYATYAKAFKSGGVNLSGLPADAAGNPALSAATVKPESVNHLEAGLKTEWFANRARLNLAAFRTDIGDYQATVVNGSVGVLRGYLANAKKVRVQGLEAEFSVTPVRHLSLYANGAYVDAKYVSFADAPCPVELTGGPQVCDISGQRLPGVSKYSASWGGEFAVPTGRKAGDEAYLGTDWSYRSSFSSSPSPSLYMWAPGTTLASFRLGYRTAGGWNAFAWVRNAFDAHYFDFLTAQPGNTGLIVGQPGDPRTYGVTLSKRF